MTLVDHPFNPPDPRTTRSPNSCRDCGRIPSVHPPAFTRDLKFERDYTTLAGQAAGYMPQDGLDHRVVESLSRFANDRAHAGPVFRRDFRLELAEEIADGRNYAVWGVQELLVDVMAGDPIAGDEYARLLGALTHLLRAWETLHQ